MNAPVISVLTTVYNREKYIAACIESVLSSTFTDWEMIIVDDCSTDNSVAIARDYEKKDTRIKVFVNDSNLGDYPNRNRAASYAIGKYIKYLDADDLIYPHGLELMVASMDRFPEAALGISQEVAEDFDPYPFLLSPYQTFKREFLARGILGLGPTGTIIRKDKFDHLGGFTGTRYIGDVEMWHQLAMYYPILKIYPGLVFWRRHDDQEIDKGINNYFYLENGFKHKLKVLKDPDNPLSPEEKMKSVKRIEKRFSKDIVLLGFKKMKFGTVQKILKSCGYNWFMVFLKLLR